MGSVILFRYLSDLRELDRDRRMFAVVVDHDGELDGFEQRPQVRFWRLCEVCREIGKRVDQRHFIGCHPLRRCRIHLVESGDLHLEMFLVLGQFVVAASQSGRKGSSGSPCCACFRIDACVLAISASCRWIRARSLRSVGRDRRGLPGRLRGPCAGQDRRRGRRRTWRRRRAGRLLEGRERSRGR